MDEIQKAIGLADDARRLETRGKNAMRKQRQKQKKTRRKMENAPESTDEMISRIEGQILSGKFSSKPSRSTTRKIRRGMKEVKKDPIMNKDTADFYRGAETLLRDANKILEANQIQIQERIRQINNPNIRKNPRQLKAAEKETKKWKGVFKKNVKTMNGVQRRLEKMKSILDNLVAQTGVKMPRKPVVIHDHIERVFPERVILESSYVDDMNDKNIAALKETLPTLEEMLEDFDGQDRRDVEELIRNASMQGEQKSSSPKSGPGEQRDYRSSKEIQIDSSPLTPLSPQFTDEGVDKHVFTQEELDDMEQEWQEMPEQLLASQSSQSSSDSEEDMERLIEQAVFKEMSPTQQMGLTDLQKNRSSLMKRFRKDFEKDPRSSRSPMASLINSSINQNRINQIRSIHEGTPQRPNTSLKIEKHVAYIDEDEEDRLEEERLEAEAEIKKKRLEKFERKMLEEKGKKKTRHKIRRIKSVGGKRTRGKGGRSRGKKRKCGKITRGKRKKGGKRTRGKKRKCGKITRGKRKKGGKRTRKGR